jgi:hypothetical protein
MSGARSASPRVGTFIIESAEGVFGLSLRYNLVLLMPDKNCALKLEWYSVTNSFGQCGA